MRKKSIADFSASEFKRLQIRFEARKEPIGNIARAFNVGEETLKRIASESKWKVRTGQLNLRAYEK